MEPMNIDATNYWRLPSNPAREIILGFLRGFVSYFSGIDRNTVGILGDFVDFAKEVVDFAEKIPKLAVGQHIVIGATVEIPPTNNPNSEATEPTENTPARGEGEQSVARCQQTCCRRNRPNPASTSNSTRRSPKRGPSMVSPRSPIASPQSHYQPTTSAVRSVQSTNPGTSMDGQIYKQVPKRKLAQPVVDFENSDGSGSNSIPMVDFDPSDTLQFSSPVIDTDNESNDSGNFPTVVDFESEPSGSSDADPVPFSENKNARKRNKQQTAVSSDDENLGYTSNSDDFFSGPSSPAPPKAPKASRYSPYSPVSDSE